MHALITGASAGIGAALARRFADAGYDLTLVARREQALRRLASDLPVRTCVRPADLSDPEVVTAVHADALDALGPVDLLINNAGIQYVEPAAGIGGERLERLIAVNLRAPLRLIHQVLPSMLDRGAGAVVNISSMSGVNPTPWMAHYSGTKAGLAATSEAMRTELAGRGVHVLTVYPGPVATDLEAAARDALERSWTARFAPTGTPEQLAERVHRALERRRARVIYPRIYAAGWWLGGLATSVVHALGPGVEHP